MRSRKNFSMLLYATGKVYINKVVFLHWNGDFACVKGQGNGVVYKGLKAA